MGTSRLLEPFLACAVKCHRLSEGEIPAGDREQAGGHAAYVKSEIEKWQRVARSAGIKPE